MSTDCIRSDVPFYVIVDLNLIFMLFSSIKEVEIFGLLCFLVYLSLMSFTLIMHLYFLALLKLLPIRI